MPANSHRERDQHILGKLAPAEWDSVALALLACTAILVLAVPVFPTQDGPVHLYYVDILRDLLRHSGPFAQHFEIKRFLTPYVLEYYSLLGLETVFSATFSEKLLICVYIFAFGLGFRYLVESVAERNNPWTLVAIPYCMNLMLYSGFLNYCVGVALVLFLLGFWIRYWRQLCARRITTLLVCFTLLLFTHPVPAAVFLLAIGVHFGVDLARASAADLGLWVSCLRERWRPLAMIAFMAGTSAVWVSMFIDPSQQPSSAASKIAQYGRKITHYDWIHKLTTALNLSGITPFTWPTYRLGLALPLAISGLACLAGVWKHRGHVSSSAIALITASAICFTLYCFAPYAINGINGSSLFSDRFAIFWIVFFAAAAAALHPPSRWSFAAGVIAFCVTGALLSVQWVNISKIARDITPVLQATPAEAGSIGLIISADNVDSANLNFHPFRWSGAHYFRRSKAVMANTPWMDSPIIMIRPVYADRWSYLDPSPAGSSLLTAMDNGDAVSELSLFVVNGASDPGMEEIISHFHWAPLTPSNGEVTIFARHPLPATSLAGSSVTPQQ